MIRNLTLVLLVFSYSLVLASGGGEQGESGSALLSLNPGMVLWTWIVFFFMVALLGAFAWKPIVAALEKREKTISDSLENAKKVAEDMELVAENQKKMLEEVKVEAEKLYSKAREDGLNTARHLGDTAREEAEKILEQARTTIKVEKDQALDELKSYVSSLAIEVAGKLIKEKLDDAQHKKFVDDYISSL